MTETDYRYLSTTFPGWTNRNEEVVCVFTDGPVRIGRGLCLRGGSHSPVLGVRSLLLFCLMNTTNLLRSVLSLVLLLFLNQLLFRTMSLEDRV